MALPERDADTPTPTPPTRVMARRIDETTTMDPSEIVTLVLAQPAGRPLRTHARRPRLVLPERVQRVVVPVAAALQTAAVVVWTAIEPWLQQLVDRSAPARRRVDERLRPLLGPRLARLQSWWNGRVAPRWRRTVTASRRDCERVWAGLAPARARAAELRPTEQTIDLFALTLIAVACGLAVLAIAAWVVSRASLPVALAAAGLALAAEAWAGHRLSRRGLSA